MFLVERGDPVLLVWPADRTTWNAQARTITFDNYESRGDPDAGRRVTVGDGMRVVLGGSGGSIAESGTTTEGWVERRQWVARPAASCPLEEWWSVGALTR